MSNNTQLAIQQIGTVIKSEKFQQNLREALPEEVPVDRFTRVAITALQQNPDLLSKDRNSLFLAVTRCAQFGLNPDGREAALVAFGSSVVCMPMVGGLRKIAAKYGINIATAVVHENDEFTYELGVRPTMTHRPAKLGTSRGEMIGAWAQAEDEDGNLYLEVMDADDMEKVRSVSRARNGDLWTKWKGEAYRKTVARRLWKSLPMYDLDERERSVADPKSDPEFAVDEQEGAVQAEPVQQRPSALQAVVNRGKPAAEDVIDVEPVDTTVTPEQTEGEQHSAEDIF